VFLCWIPVQELRNPTPTILESICPLPAFLSSVRGCLIPGVQDPHILVPPYLVCKCDDRPVLTSSIFRTRSFWYLWACSVGVDSRTNCFVCYPFTSTLPLPSFGQDFWYTPFALLPILQPLPLRIYSYQCLGLSISLVYTFYAGVPIKEPWPLPSSLIDLLFTRSGRSVVVCW